MKIMFSVCNVKFVSFIFSKVQIKVLKFIYFHKELALPE